MPPQYIFTMKDLRKVTPQGKEILQGHLAVVLPGRQDRRAGRQRGGQVARCCASWPAWTRTSPGEAFAADGHARSATCRRSRSSTPSKTVLEHVEEAVAAQRAIVTRYEELSADWSDENADELGRLQDQIDAQNLWELDRQLEIAMDALRLPPRGRGRRRRSRAASGAASRCARSCCSSRTCCCWTSPRTTWTRSRSAWLERFLKEYPGTVVAVTHDRYFLDNVAGLDPGAGPRRGHPVGGQLLVLAGAEEEPAGAGGEGGVGPAAHAASASWSGSACRPARARPRARRASRSTRSCWPRSRRRTSATAAPRSRSRPARAWATWSSRPRACARPTATTLLMDDVDFILPRGGIVGVIGPNGAGKTTLFRMIVGPGEAGRGRAQASARRVELSYVDQSRDTLDGRPHGLGGDLRRRQGHHHGRQARGELPRLRGHRSTSAGPTSRRR